MIERESSILVDSHHFPGLGRLLLKKPVFENTCRIINDQSLHDGSKYILEQLGVNITSQSALEFDVKGKPILFIGNHPGRLEPLFLASVLKRDDISVIGDYELSLINGIGKHILPVKSTEFAKGEKRKGSFRRRYIYPRYLTSKEIRDLNLNSLKKAVDLLQQGSMVGIFPTGGSKGMNSDWHEGLGFIIKHLLKVAPGTQAIVLPINFVGFNQKNFNHSILRVVMGLRPLPCQVQVQFGQSLDISMFTSLGNNSKAITNRIKEIYLENFSQEVN